MYKCAHMYRYPSSQCDGASPSPAKVLQYKSNKLMYRLYNSNVRAVSHEY